MNNIYLVSVISENLSLNTFEDACMWTMENNINSKGTVDLQLTIT